MAVMEAHAQAAPAHADGHHEGDYHGHPNYIKTYLSLLTLFALSLLVGMIHEPLFALLMIFGMAIIKIMFVVNNFMHLRFEPYAIWFAVAFGVACCAIFYFGVFPDIMWVPIEVVK